MAASFGRSDGPLGSMRVRDVAYSYYQESPFSCSSDSFC
jgi:hypothetical protein